jgi:Vitamin B6 photo-protection and homoeostasis
LLPQGNPRKRRKNQKKKHVLILSITIIIIVLGYPDSVAEDYLDYQKWDTVQAFASTITGCLATHSVLKGIGVGDQESSALSATVTWILKDGAGHLGRIFFAYLKG